MDGSKGGDKLVKNVAAAHIMPECSIRHFVFAVEMSLPARLLSAATRLKIKY
jgi:hypothetical protein